MPTYDSWMIFLTIAKLVTLLFIIVCVITIHRSNNKLKKMLAQNRTQYRKVTAESERERLEKAVNNVVERARPWQLSVTDDIRSPKAIEPVVKDITPIKTYSVRDMLDVHEQFKTYGVDPNKVQIIHNVPLLRTGQQQDGKFITQKSLTELCASGMNHVCGELFPRTNASGEYNVVIPLSNIRIQIIDTRFVNDRLLADIAFGGDEMITAYGNNMGKFKLTYFSDVDVSGTVVGILPLRVDYIPKGK